MTVYLEVWRHGSLVQVCISALDEAGSGSYRRLSGPEVMIAMYRRNTARWARQP